MADLNVTSARFMKDVGFLEFRLARNWRGYLVHGAETGEAHLRRCFSVDSLSVRSYPFLMLTKFILLMTPKRSFLVT